MPAVIAKIYLDLGWPYKKRPANPYRSPSGTLTFADAEHPVPCNVDREILLYIIKIGNETPNIGDSARGSLTELATWLGTQRRRRLLRQHLERVFSCRIVWRKSETDIREIRIGDIKIFPDGSFLARLDPSFHESCLVGVPYSIEQASRFRTEPALLDLYLALVDFVHPIRGYDEFTHEFRPYEKLPLPETDRQARFQLGRRLEKLRDACPGVVFTMAPTNLGIYVDIGRPKRITRAGVSRYDWEARERYGRMIRKLDPEYRRQLGTLVHLLTEVERRLQGPDVWSQVLDVLDQAGKRTERAFERIEELLGQARPGGTPEPESGDDE